MFWGVGDNEMLEVEGERVKESCYYGHVGSKANVKGDTPLRSGEKVKSQKSIKHGNLHTRYYRRVS